MKYIADLHIHSHYSRSTSKEMNLESLHRWAQIKGINVLGTGDFTHPAYFKELTGKLVKKENGFYELKQDIKNKVDKTVPESCKASVAFVPTAEISCIYKKNDKTRKVHNLVIAPDLESVKKINKTLDKIGNIKSDGRPILGLDSEILLEIVLEANSQCIFIPAHAWTPHFSVLGAFSRFSTIEECYGELSKHIFAVETGLSSDPPMNWRLSSLDRFTLISNSDAHSPPKLAREANLFNTDMAFASMRKAIKLGDGKTFLGTLEFFPEEGKYHYDGHRACSRRMTPQENIQAGFKCPDCGGKTTVGVLNRVEELADRAPGKKHDKSLHFENLIPLQEIIGEMYSVGVNSKKVQGEYFNMVTHFGNELKILREIPLEDLAMAASRKLVEGIQRVRTGDIYVAPGYDGEYGTIKIFDVPRKKPISGGNK
ncbi:MAG: endonuclease Q family protein [bacterium]